MRITMTLPCHSNKHTFPFWTLSVSQASGGSGGGQYGHQRRSATGHRRRFQKVSEAWFTSLRPHMFCQPERYVKGIFVVNNQLANMKVIFFLILSLLVFLFKALKDMVSQNMRRKRRRPRRRFWRQLQSAEQQICGRLLVWRLTWPEPHCWKPGPSRTEPDGGVAHCRDSEMLGYRCSCKHDCIC